MPTELSTRALAMRPMLAGDIPAGMDLVRAAGWNQTEADWRYMLAHGRGFAIDDGDGQAIASAVVLLYPPNVGWIGMVLVAPAYRRRGLATRLVEAALAAITDAGTVAMLDATPDGRTVYQAMGFRDLKGIGRWRGTGAGRGSTSLAMTDELAARGMAADASAFGSDRSDLLANLRGRAGAVALAAPQGGGWLWSRAGRTATQIGPIIATGANDAAALCAAALDCIGGPIVIDVPDRETGLIALLTDRGFSLERKLTRMARGGAPRTLGPATHTIAGPELG